MLGRPMFQIPIKLELEMSADKPRSLLGSRSLFDTRERRCSLSLLQTVVFDRVQGREWVHTRPYRTFRKRNRAMGT